MSLPVWLRAVIVLVVLAGTAVFLNQKFLHSDSPKPDEHITINLTGLPPAIAGTTEPGRVYTGGSPDPSHPGAVNNAQNQEAAHKSSEDDAAYQWHTNHQAEDSPSELPVAGGAMRLLWFRLKGDADKDNFLHYRYYDNSDKCVLINRRVKGVDHAQWIRDPQFCKHNIDSPSASANAPEVARIARPPDRIPSFLDGLVPAAQAAAPIEVPAQLEPVQAGYCVNPHPGTFSSWWGAPIDQCNSPMYRQFNDGCTHYQIYNRCANAWDGRIFWAACHAPPHY